MLENMFGKNDKEREIARKNTQRAEYCWENGNRRWNERGRESERFRAGDQWDEETLAQLGADQRPAITLNLVHGIIELIVGQQIESKVDLTYKPVHDDELNVEGARILTQLAKQTGDDNSYHFHESEITGDGFVTGRGYLELTLDREDNEKGEARVRSISPLMVMPDVDANEYDPRGWRDVMIHRFYSLEEIEDLWGKKKAEEVKTRGAELNQVDYSSDNDGPIKEGFGDQDRRIGESLYEIYRADDAGNEQYRVIERQWWKKDTYLHFVYPEGDIRPVPEYWGDERVNSVAQNGVELKMLEKKRVRHTVSCGDVLLADQWGPYRAFTIVPYFPFFHRGETTSLVDQIKSPQELLNKSISQELHIVNTTANSGWMWEQGSLANMTDDEMEAVGATTGLSIVVKKGSNYPQKITPNTIPSGIEQLARSAEEAIKQITGASDQARGFAGAEVSGVAQDLKQKRFGVLLNRAMANLDYTRHIFAKNLLHLYQDFYTEARTVMITKNSGGKTEFEPLKLNQATPEGGVLNDLTIGEYGVVVSSTPVSDTYSEGAYAQALDMRREGVPIPDNRMILLSSLPDKTEIADEVKTMSQGGAEPDASEMKRQSDRFEAETAKIKAEALRAEADAKQKLVEVEGKLLEIAGIQNDRLLGAQADMMNQGIDAEMEAKKAGMMAPPPDSPTQDMQPDMGDIPTGF